MTQFDQQTPDLQSLIDFLERLIERIGAMEADCETIHDPDQKKVLAVGLSQAREIVVKMISDLQAQTCDSGEATVAADAT